MTLAAKIPRFSSRKLLLKFLQPIPSRLHLVRRRQISLLAARSLALRLVVPFPSTLTIIQTLQRQLRPLRRPQQTPTLIYGSVLLVRLELPLPPTHKILTTLIIHRSALRE